MQLSFLSGFPLFHNKFSSHWTVICPGIPFVTETIINGRNTLITWCLKIFGNFTYVTIKAQVSYARNKREIKLTNYICSLLLAYITPQNSICSNEVDAYLY